MADTPSFETELERELYEALLVTAGYLDSLAGTVLDEKRTIRFTGEHAHIGVVTLGEVLDKADAALGRAGADNG